MSWNPRWPAATEGATQAWRRAGAARWHVARRRESVQAAACFAVRLTEEGWLPQPARFVLRESTRNSQVFAPRGVCTVAYGASRRSNGPPWPPSLARLRRAP
eukprot:5157048-Prymnesium_polylepis.1